MQNKWKIGVIVSFVLLLVACEDAKNSAPVFPEQAELSQPTATHLMTPTDAVLSRLKTQQVSEVDWFSILAVSGTIELNEKHVAHVGSTVSGRITEILHVRGDRVQKGDVLAVVHSAALAEAQAAYLQAQTQYQLAQQAAQRARILLSEGVIAEVEQQRRDGEYLSSEVQWQAAYDRMRILGMQKHEIQSLEKSRKINSLVALRAPMNGIVIDHKVSQGQVIEPADLAYTVADLSQVWVVGEVPERYATDMQPNKQIQVSIPALNEVRDAQLNYVANVVSSQTRTLSVRAELGNADERLKPDMLVSLSVLGNAQRRLAIPESAVIREDNEDKVFVKLSQQQFMLKSVKLGDEERGLRPVIGGLVEGQEIAVDGVFYLNAERLMMLEGE